ncbi:MAG: zinc dependent phospholipase C family protein [Eubacterium sp.]|jgi:hypothetical protein|nr:zinc dependent phospholipase C family protein [Eubacterium sp.]NBI87291.1 hypothetical protein [Lachnospiraceae bacterium]
MPGFTTHYLFGQQTYQHLHTSGLKQNIQKYHKVFSLGLQGPDIFFYDILSLILSDKNPGSVAHTADTHRFLRYLLESPQIFIQNKEKEIARAYIMGFIGHYLLDTACHPYVYAMTDVKRPQKGYIGRHIRLETDLDTVLLWFYQRRRPSEFKQNETIHITREQRTVVSSLLNYAFTQTYPGVGPTRKRIVQAIHGMQVGTRLLYDPTGHKKLLIRRIESVIPGYPLLSPLVANDHLLFHKDPCNTRHVPWRNPWDEEIVSTESFFDLFEKAQDEYSRLFERAAQFLEEEHTKEEKEEAVFKVLKELGNRCYHSGLSAEVFKERGWRPKKR